MKSGNCTGCILYAEVSVITTLKTSNSRDMTQFHCSPILISFYEGDMLRLEGDTTNRVTGENGLEII